MLDFRPGLLQRRRRPGRSHLARRPWFCPVTETPVDVHQEAELLRNVPFFAGLDRAKLKLLAFTSASLQFAPGEVIVRQGEPGDSAFVVLEGEVEIVRESPGGEILLTVQGRNALVGEMGVLTNAPRAATGRARTPVRMLRISRDVFLKLIAENPPCALHVMRLLSSRLAEQLHEHERLREQLREAQTAAGIRVS
jgi:CRP-like cAMP-binding protein